MDVQSDAAAKGRFHRMKAAIRVDASIQIGSGHVVRCLTLARTLREAGAEVVFLCRDHPGHMADQIREQGFAIELLGGGGETTSTNETDLTHAAWLGCTQQTDALQCQRALAALAPVDWLIVDHYALDARWQTILRPLVKQVMVIDDLADRDHDCDLLLDQNLGRQARDYAAHVPTDCSVLCGPHFALLRPEFAKLRAQSLLRQRTPLRQILITLGGVDQDNVTGQVLRVLKECNLPQEIQVTVVMGRTAPHVEQVRDQAAHMPFHCEVAVAVSDMGERMMQADLAIGAAGSTTWERACLGLPSLIVVLAGNQKGIAREISRAGAALYAGDAAQEGFAAQLRDTIGQCLTQPKTMAKMSNTAARIVDGKGAVRLCQHMVASDA